MKHAIRPSVQPLFGMARVAVDDGKSALAVEAPDFSRGKAV